MFHKMKDLLVDYEYLGVRGTKPFCKIKGGNPECVVTDVYLAPKAETQETPVQQEEGINPMYPYKTATTKPAVACSVAGNNISINAPATPDTAEAQRDYLRSRALDTVSHKLGLLREKFKLEFYYEPKTVKEAADRIKAGLFTMVGDDGEVDGGRYQYLSHHFSWRGPDDQPDYEGFNKASADFSAFYDPILDEIRIFDPKDALESFRKIEAYAV